MYFLCSTVATIRDAFKQKKKMAEDEKARFKLKRREYNTIVKLGIIMGKVCCAC